jgi:DNA polymerase-3 subunit alpha
VRHVGVHAAGVVVAPTPLVEWTPLQPDPKGTGKIITQYDMYSITDEYGGVGFSSSTSSASRTSPSSPTRSKRVKETRGIDIDIENVPLDDAKTFEMLARGETEGTFQLNGSGMTRYSRSSAHDHPRHQRDGGALSPGADGNDPAVHRAQAQSEAHHFLDRA